MAGKAGRRGFGNIKRIGNRWRADYRDPQGRTRLSRSGNPTPVRHSAPSTFTARIDAEAWLVAERRLIDQGTWTPPAVREAQRRAALEADQANTFRAYAEHWLEARRDSKGKPLAPSTRQKYETLLRIHLLPTFGQVPLVDLTRSMIRDWYAQPDLAAVPTQRAHAYNLLRGILATATAEDELLDKNPAYIRGAGQRHRVKEVRPATLDELAVIAANMPERLQLLVQLAAWCGLRSGELRELRRSDVKLGRYDNGDAYGWLRVRRGVVTVRKAPDELHSGDRLTKHVVGDPKTTAGKRDISIPPFLLPELRQHLLTYAALGPDGLLFPSSNGGTLTDTTIRGRAAVLDADGDIVKRGTRGFFEARRLAGREDLTLHDLRHTGASLAGEAGASLAELMHRLGHSTSSMALLYQHSSRDRDEALARRLSHRAEEGR